MTLNNSISSSTKGLLFVAVGILGYLLVGIPFLLRLVITCFSFISIECGLTLLKLPTCWQLVQKFIVNFYRS